MEFCFIFVIIFFIYTQKFHFQTWTFIDRNVYRLKTIYLISQNGMIYYSHILYIDVDWKMSHKYICVMSAFSSRLKHVRAHQ